LAAKPSMLSTGGIGLRSRGASQLKPANNPGRVSAGFLGGAGLGGVGEELGLRFLRL
jgi:hypothetical protein